MVFRSIVVLLLAIGIAPLAARAQVGGLVAFEETFYGWRLGCGVGDWGYDCTLSQMQALDGAFLFSVKLRTERGNALRGNLVLRPGLSPDVALVVGDKPVPSQLASRVCEANGCRVPFYLGAASVRAMRAGTPLRIRVTSGDTGREMLLATVMEGFPTAYDRLVNLSAN